MATGMSQTLAHACLTDEVADYTWVQLHTATPGAAGTTAIAVETDRIQATWGTPSAGVMSNTAALTWTAVAGTEDFTHYSVWTLVTGGVFGHSGLITANAVTTGDTFTIPIGDLDVSFPLAS